MFLTERVLVVDASLLAFEFRYFKRVSVLPDEAQIPRPLGGVRNRVAEAACCLCPVQEGVEDAPLLRQFRPFFLPLLVEVYIVYR